MNDDVAKMYLFWYQRYTESSLKTELDYWLRLVSKQFLDSLHWKKCELYVMCRAEIGDMVTQKSEFQGYLRINIDCFTYSLGKKLLMSHEKVRSLDLTLNFGSSEYIEENELLQCVSCFINLRRLRMLQKQPKCSLNAISLRDLHGLRNLVLEGFTHLGTDQTFENLSKLKVLTLIGSFDFLTEGAFKNLPRLESLSLFGSFDSLTNEAIKNLPNLKRLRIKGRCTKITQSICRCLDHVKDLLLMIINEDSRFSLQWAR